MRKSGGMRSSRVNYPVMSFVSTKFGQFTYFAQQLGEKCWRGKNVLDFGGNVGNILRDPNSTIEHERYWCVDVVKESIEKGKAAFPTSHWIFYDRCCFFFNPNGAPRLPLPHIEQRFDYIVAYSVFTNTTQTDMFDLVGQLRGMLADDGVLAFTFIDPHYYSWPDEYKGDNFRWRLEREIYLASQRGEVLNLDIATLTHQARYASWCVLVNADDLYVENEDIKQYAVEDQKTFHVFYTVEHMRGLFPEASIMPPANNEMQHCCLFTRS